MSTHFKRTVAVIVALAAILAGAFLWLRHKLGGPDLKLGSGPSTLLRKNDREVVSYDSTSHTLTVTTSSGTVRSYTRDPVIHIQKDGKILIQKKLFGFEHRPFMGLGYSLNGFQAYGGLYLLDVWRLDAGFALGYHPGSLRPLLIVGYNLWSNTSLGLGLDYRQVPHLLCTVQF